MLVACRSHRFGSSRSPTGFGTFLHALWVKRREGCTGVRRLEREHQAD
jgi:hypothetical protein